MKSLEILDTLRRSDKPVFTLSDISKLVGKPRTQTKIILHRLMKRKLITRIERGKYYLDAHPFAVSSNITFPSYISFLTALNYYELTTQISKIIFIATNKFKKSLTLENYAVEFIKINKDRFFGYKRERFHGKFLFIGDVEKVILDSLYLPQYCPIAETFEAVKSKTFDLDKLVSYAVRMNSSVVAKRLGYMLDISGVDIYDRIKNKITKKFDLLNPKLPKKKNKHKKWKLIVNEVLE